MASLSAVNCRDLIDPHPRLRLPPALHSAYRAELEDRGLLPAAVVGSMEKNIHGGPTPEETLEHFKYRFTNSAVRVVCVLVDPAHVFASLPAEVFQSFSSHKIAVLDVACGAGASLLSLATVLGVVRSARLLPSLPLELSVYAADISETALAIYSNLVGRIGPILEQQGISLRVTTTVWDAAHPDQTSALCDSWFSDSSDANEHFVLVGNISGVGKGAFDHLERSFLHIGERIANRASTLLWIEPGISSSLSFMQKVVNLVRRKLSWLTRSTGVDETLSCEFAWWHPIEEKELAGTVSVQRFSRSKASEL